MRKAVAIVGQDPILDEMVGKIQENTVRAGERLTFLEKQIADLKKGLKDENRPVWDQIEALLGARSLLPEKYTKDTHHFTFDEDTSVIYVCDKDHKLQNHPMMALLGNFFQPDLD